jgi:ParB family chromosome partitioning protein
MTEKRLGRGLAQIIETTAAPGDQLVNLRIEQIRPGRYQPREAINDAALEELKASIKQRGVIQPVIVRPIAHGIYELVAGERRWRAAQAVGRTEIPAIVRALSDQETLEWSLVENVQREGLNPLEEAKALARLVEEFGYTQETLADALGKERSSVANCLRLLKLPEDVQAALRDGKISTGHAKVLLGVDGRTKQLELCTLIHTKQLSVRQLEALAGDWQPAVRRAKRVPAPQLKALEDDLRQLLGTKVTVSGRKRGGRIIVEYFSQEELTRIMHVLGAQHE